MFNKRATYTIIETEPLNKPVLQNYIKDQDILVDKEAVSNTIQKIAETSKESSEKDGDGTESVLSFDLEAEIKEHSDSLFIRCFAIKADETNDNGDYFSRNELIKATPTFVGVPLFTNHANSDINEARGKVVHSWWDNEKNGIMIVGRVDAVAYPQLARGIREKYVLGTSMGCFPPGCRVLMADGTYLPISEVQSGDFVYTHKGRTQEVINSQIRYKKEFIKQISFEGYSSGLEVTKNHPILTLKTQKEEISNDASIECSKENLVWKKSQDLNKDDLVLTPEMELSLSFSNNVYTNLLGSKSSEKNVYTNSNNYLVRKIKNITNSFYDGPVYNLQVAKDNSYIVEDVAVKNCQVQYSLCSICHNYAETPDDYCSHIREQKTREVHSNKIECKYHTNGNEDKCPMCECEKGKKKTFASSGKAFEFNYGIKFIENSFVVNPACSTCGVTEVIDPQKFLDKVAEIEKILPKLLKAASDSKATFCTDTQCIKIAGQQELDSLNQALDLLSSVSQAMLSQKEQIDLEFLSDLVTVLADLQTVVDELTEQGYGRLPSPDGTQPQPGQPEAEQGMQAPGGEVTRSVQPVNPTPGGGSKIHSGPAGQVGSVTSPLASTKILNLKKLSYKMLNVDKSISIPDLKIHSNIVDPRIKMAIKKLKLSFKTFKKS